MISSLTQPMSIGAGKAIEQQIGAQLLEGDWEDMCAMLSIFSDARLLASSLCDELLAELRHKIRLGALRHNAGT